MHKLFWFVAAIGVVAGVSALPAEDSIDVGEPNGFKGIDAPEMTSVEMDETEGALFARGSRRSNRITRHRWRDRASRTDRVHCDILARNRAESLGRDTSSPDGKFRNYNNITVNQIYEAHRGNRYTKPPRGTAGYIFTGGADGKTHLQVYDNRAGGNRYTRYSNRSYQGTESVNRVRPEYRGDGATKQIFVPLPRRDHRMVWSW